MLENEERTKLYATRWIVAGLILLIGFQIGLGSILWGVFHEFTEDYFSASVETVDGVSIAFNLGGYLMIPPLLVVTQQYDNILLYLLQCGIAFFGLGFFIQSISLALQQSIAILILGNVFAGIGVLITFSACPLAITVWFSEREQGALFGVMYLSIGLGKLIATALPSLLNLAKSEQAYDLVTLLSSLAGIDLFVVLLLLSPCFLPNLPKIPPSIAESNRLALCQSQRDVSFCTNLKKNYSEIRYLFCDKTSLILIISLSTFMGMYLVQFVMMPVPQYIPGYVNVNSTLGNQTNVELARSHALIVFSCGGILGSISAGLALDRIKKYQPLASIISVSLLTSSVVILLGIYCNMFILQCVACGFYGFYSFAANCFFTEILKQYIYPKVSENSFGILILACTNFSVIINTAILRQFLKHFGSLIYMAVFCVIIMLTKILALSICPKLTRFEYETENTKLVD